jgi:hypothetical protein
MKKQYKQLNLWSTTPGMEYDCLLASVFTHRNTGEKLRIKKLHGTIATCESEITTVITEKPYLATNTVICKLENLDLCTM